MEPEPYEDAGPVGGEDFLDVGGGVFSSFNLDEEKLAHKASFSVVFLSVDVLLYLFLGKNANGRERDVSIKGQLSFETLAQMCQGLLFPIK